MKKNKIFVLLGTFLSLSSCGGGVSGSEEPSIPSSSSSSFNVPTTGNYLVKDKKSDYTILIPSNADENVVFAANELQSFIEESTKVTLPISKDEMYSSTSDKFISLGNTIQFQNSDITIPETLKQTGYVLKRKENSLYISSRHGAGVYSAVYDFLENEIGLEIYSYDEWTLEEKSEIPLRAYNVEFKPLFDMRQVLIKSLAFNRVYNRRLRFVQDLGLGKWAAFAHTTMTDFLPYGTYGTEHPDWYNDSRNQVCYSNPEVLKEMAEVMKARLDRNVDAQFIQMGHEDNLDMCTCANCVKEREELGNYGGQELEFTNKLQEILDPWLAAKYPGRTVKYVFFAYQTSQQPPAKLNEVTNKYEPISPKFRVNPNVMVMYCPIDAEFSKKMADPENSVQREQIRGWGDLFDGAKRHGEIYIWTYSLLAKSSLIPMNNFGTYEEHYRFFEECGATCILDQSYYFSAVPGFEALKNFTMGRLQYDNKYTYKDLVSRFMDNYYGEASSTLKEYYSLLRSYYAYLGETKNVGTVIMSELYDRNYWSFEFLERVFKMLEKAISSLDVSSEEARLRSELIKERIRQEEVFPLYMMLRFYMNQLSQEEKESYWTILNDICNRVGVVASMEGSYDVGSTLESWKSTIFGA